MAQEKSSQAKELLIQIDENLNNLNNMTKELEDEKATISELAVSLRGLVDNFDKVTSGLNTLYEQLGEQTQDASANLKDSAQHVGTIKKVADGFDEEFKSLKKFSEDTTKKIGNIESNILAIDELKAKTDELRKYTGEEIKKVKSDLATEQKKSIEEIKELKKLVGMIKEVKKEKDRRSKN